MWNKKVILNWLLSLNSKQFIWGFRIAVCVSCVMYGLFFGYVIGLLVILSCFVAFRLPILLIYFNELYLGEFNELPKLWGSFKKTKSKDEPSSQAVASQPYFLVEDNSLVVDTEVNEAMEKFLNGVLEKFVGSWQSSLEVKEEFFIIELRHLMKYMILRLYEIVQKVDLSDLLIEKVIPIFLWHLDCYTSGLTSVHSKEIERCALSCIGPNLHPAVASRKAEQLHLKHYSKQILDCLLPNQVKTSSLLTIFLRDLLGCQILQNAMDALADPDNINKFIILWLEENEALTDSSSLSTDKYIPLLQNFTKHSSSKPADMSMYPNLSSILKTASHLYQFMQFLKREGTLKYLQFLLAVDEFNEKLLNPDLSIEQMKHLQFLGQKMHQNFFSDTSSDCVGFSKESEAQMKLIVYGATKDIVLLRTCPTLFQAYDHVMDILEQKLLFRFYRSPEFLEILTGAQQSGGSSRSSKKKEANPAPGWGKGSFRKLRAALRPGWLLNDTRLLGNTDEEFDTGIDLTEADFIPEDTEVEPEAAGAYADLIPVSGRDLTAWRTCIPRVVPIADSPGKQNWGFEVEIQRIDIRPEDDPEEYHWSVVRTYVEFYQLESKLTEFHGEFTDIRLKPKKIFGTRSCDFLQSVRAEFESFLRTLLQQPSLKGSDLIFSFLTLSNLSTSQTSGEGGMASNFLDLGLGKMLREVPLKLRKEKGQHLESFIQTYIASTEAPKARPSKVEVRDQSGEVSAPVSSTLHPIFLDNAKTFLNINGKISRPVLHTVNPIKIDGPYDCLLFAAWKIWQIPQLLWNILAGLRSLVNFYFDSFARKFVREKLNRALQPQKIKMAVKLLQEIVLEDSSSSKGQELEHRRAAWNSIQSAIKKSVPDWLINFVGHQSIDERCKIIFQCLQYPVLNKQLSYVLFDIVLHVLLPEENCTEVP